MNKYLEQFQSGTYSFTQFLNIIKELGFTSVGFEKEHYDSDDHVKLYHIEDYGLRPDEGFVETRSYNNTKYRAYRSPKNYASCFEMPATYDKSSDDCIYCKNRYGFADDNGAVYEVALEAAYKDNNKGSYYFQASPTNIIEIKIKTRKLNNMQLFADRHFLNSQSELATILTNNNVWLKKFADDVKIKKLEYLLMAPYIETLYKANYEFMKDFIYKISDTKPQDERYRYWYSLDQGYLDKINRLCQQGKSPKEIFKAPKELYDALKDYPDIDIWDHLRVMCKMDNLSPECALLVIDQNYSERDLRMIRGILNKEYQGKKVFTFETLANYLNRLDMHEALDRYIALEILNDYLMMCNQLQMEPKIDGDSLKREHDIAARLCRQKRDTMFNQKIAERNEYLKKYDWTGDTYLIRAIKDQEDLIDEATQ